MAYDQRASWTCRRRSGCGSTTSCRRAAGPRRRAGSEGEPLTLKTTLGRALFNEALPVDYPFVDEPVDKKRALGDRQRPRRALPEGRRSPRRSTRSRRPASTGPPAPASRSRSRTSSRRRARPEILERLRGPGREGPEPVRARPDHRRRAPPGAHRDLDPGHQRGRRGDGGQLPDDQPGLHDGQLRCPREQDAGPPDRRHAWPGGQPEGRDHPAPDQVQLPRGPVGARVLHLHATAPARVWPTPRCGPPTPGYLTRRLVDVSQDVIIREDDCGTDRGLDHADRGGQGADGSAAASADDVETSVYARTLAEDVDGRTARSSPRPAPTSVTSLDRRADRRTASTEVKVRSVLTCDSKVGTCAKCYGRSLATGKLVDVGEAVGIIAAQSIGEPGTQLTMRTFHTGGVGG